MTVSTLISSLAQRVASTADFVHRAAAPVDEDGAKPVPSFLRQSVEEIHGQLERGAPFSVSDLPAYIDAVKNLNGAGIDDRLYLLEKVLVLMSRLPPDSQFSATLQNYVIDILYKDLPHPPASFLSSSSGGTSLSSPNTHQVANLPQPSSINPNPAAPTYVSRPSNGYGYNPLMPTLGMAGSSYARSVPGEVGRSKQSLPDAGRVFDVLLRRREVEGSKSTLTWNGANGVGGTENGVNGNGHAANGVNGVNENGHGTPPPPLEQFTPHPGGLSSLFFAFADLVIHSIFHTSPTSWSTNLASSYLDLSPLYGNNDEEVDAVRKKVFVKGEGDGVEGGKWEKEGGGEMWEDVFADKRILGMPPSVGALLVLFCRNHNYIARTLLSINELSTYIPPSSSSYSTLSQAEKNAQDDEIFARARLVNCGFFMQVILGDYVGAILGLVRDGLSWRLDPLSPMRELSHEPSPRGAGNTVSIEFNLLYRWHATLSQHDTAWTEGLFRKLWPDVSPDEVTVEMFVRGARGLLAGGESGVREWSIDGPNGVPLQRSSDTGRFADADLAAILQNATDAPAGAFRARGIPAVLKVVEVMGIEQSRSWGACSLNEFRKFMGLKPYGSFKEWNPDPEIHTAAEALYEDIDNLELHVGMQAEQAKPAILGSGLCPGFTISRTILADAVALTRGDPFLTTQFTTFNLTTWGHADCYPDKDDGSYGGMLTRLLFRTLPDHYPARSTYAHFPFLVPADVKKFMQDLRDSPVAEYNFDRPAVPKEVVVVKSAEGVRDVLMKSGKEFGSGLAERVKAVVRVSKVDIAIVNNVLNAPNELKRYGPLFTKMTNDLIREKSTPYERQPGLFLDVIRDVANLVAVRFVATELAGIPLKTAATPHGQYTDRELFEKLADVANYLHLNTDAGNDWVLRGKAIAVADELVPIIKHHLQKVNTRALSIGGLTDSVMHWVSGENTRSHAFLSSVTTSFKTQLRGKKKMSLDEQAYSVFISAAGTAAIYGAMMAQIIDFFLHGAGNGGAEVGENLAAVCREEVSEKSNRDLVAFAREALRLQPPISKFQRVANVETKLHDGTIVEPGQKVYCSVTAANFDASVFGPDPAAFNYQRGKFGVLGVGEQGLVTSTFFEATVPHVLRAVFGLPHLHRAPPPSGIVNRITQTVRGCEEIAFVDFKGRITPFAFSLIAQYGA